MVDVAPPRFALGVQVTLPYEGAAPSEGVVVSCRWDTVAWRYEIAVEPDVTLGGIYEKELRLAGPPDLPESREPEEVERWLSI